MTPAGRPQIGTPINVRLGDGLLAAVDAKANRLGISRAEMIREVLDDSLRERNPMTDIDRRAVVGLVQTLNDLADKACAQKGEYGQGLQAAYERAAEHAEEILK